MKMHQALVTFLLAGCAATAWGQPGARDPHIGYLYPAGGQQGSTFHILVGGQALRGGSDVYVSGEGVHASVVKFYRPIRNLDADQRKELQSRLRDAWQKQWVALHGETRPPILPGNAFLGKGPAKAKPPTEEAPRMQIPEHPLLDELDTMDLRGLTNVVQELAEMRKRQQNAQIAEMVKIEVTIDADATPGDRELRIRTAGGLTNPMCFQVGVFPEACEREPNSLKLYPFLPDEQPLELPVLLNGQVMPGDVDRTCFRAKKDQRLVLETHARRLVPYLADAVPGWFQPTITLFGPDKLEVAFEDDYRFDPDPVLFFKVPQDGVYELEIRDSIYRGREDFVYRIDSNTVLYAVDALPECDENESNDSARNAQRISLPSIVNGRLARSGDIDVFEFEGRAGEEIVAEIVARRLNSPMDSVLRLMDAGGQVLEWNDDFECREAAHPWDWRRASASSCGDGPAARQSRPKPSSWAPAAACRTWSSGSATRCPRRIPGIPPGRSESRKGASCCPAAPS